jgi:hypothetical protein
MLCFRISERFLVFSPRTVSEMISVFVGIDFAAILVSFCIQNPENPSPQRRPKPLRILMRFFIDFWTILVPKTTRPFVAERSLFRTKFDPWCHLNDFDLILASQYRFECHFGCWGTPLWRFWNVLWCYFTATSNKNHATTDQHQTSCNTYICLTTYDIVFAHALFPCHCA